jgi:hypothetical protein
MKPSQISFLASALLLTAGLYLLAGPFAEDRHELTRLLPTWGTLLAYEAAVLGMIRILRTRSLPHGTLTAVSMFLLGDPLFTGDAFASVHVGRGLAFNAAAAGFALGKAAALSWALGIRPSALQRAAAAAGLAAIHLLPSLVVRPSERPTDLALAAAWVALPPALLLLRAGGLAGRAGAVALAVHVAASAAVAGAAFTWNLSTPLLLALSAALPWPRFGWIPLPLAVLTTPLRTWAGERVSLRDGIGVGLVLLAFGLLAFGFASSLRKSVALQRRTG